MAFDGIITRAITKELKDKLLLGKIEKVYQPEKDELVFNIHTKSGNLKLYTCVQSSHSCIHFIEKSPKNPPAPLSFCMLLRKHLQGSRIVDISQNECERIIEFSLESLSELGFTLSKKLIVEIMGKHSNVILVDMTSGKVIDSIKRISLDVNRARQILPGIIYKYPPAQDKIPFDKITREEFSSIPPSNKAYLSQIGGISPSIARALEESSAPFEYLSTIVDKADKGDFVPRVYVDKNNVPREFHIANLPEFEESCEKIEFSSLSEALDFYFENKESSSRKSQKSHDLIKSITATLDKHYLKEQRLKEDLLKAKNSEDLRLYGELLTANIHLIKPGMKEITLENYYDGTTVTIPLDERHSPGRNASDYYKKYGKMKTSIKEKQIQIEENHNDITYLESVLTYLNNAGSIDEIESLRQELVETGYIRKGKTTLKEKKYKAAPHKYETSDGFKILVGRNNKENDILTLKTASKKDYWFHTKDIPGSHVILITDGKEVPERSLFEAAEAAAYHSKARTSENVPVDYVLVKNVKKPSGAKPGMVIFTGNKTLWVNPKLPEKPNL